MNGEAAAIPPKGTLAERLLRHAGAAGDGLPTNIAANHGSSGRERGISVTRLSIDLPDAPGLALKELRMAAAMKFHELRRLSSGVAAELAGVRRTAFLMPLVDYGVDTFASDYDLTQETPLV